MVVSWEPVTTSTALPPGRQAARATDSGGASAVATTSPPGTRTTASPSPAYVSSIDPSGENAPTALTPGTGSSSLSPVTVS